MTIFGVFLGGIVVKKYGILNALVLSGFLQIVSNLFYVLLDQMGANFLVLIITVAAENLSGGAGSAAFVAYLSVLCNRNYTATQYALLSSIMGFTRTLLSSPSGFLVEFLGWSQFFVFSTILGLPGIFILFWMKKKFPLEMQKTNFK